MSNYANLKGTTSLQRQIEQRETLALVEEQLHALTRAARLVGVSANWASIAAEMTERRARAWEMILLADDEGSITGMAEQLDAAGFGSGGVW
jgi:uncharacterized protein with PIN domain